jgi:hypothetical protein
MTDNAYRTPGGRWVLRSNSDPTQLRGVDLDEPDARVPLGWHVVTEDEYETLLDEGTDATVEYVVQEIAREAAARN